jgi:hypothetical protein
MHLPLDQTDYINRPSCIPPFPSLPLPDHFQALSFPRSLDIMRFSTVFVVLSAAFATTSASLLENRQTGYASCALPCLTTITSASCAANDTKCLCQDKDFVNKTTLCFQTNCTGTDLTKSVAAAVEMCRSVGVTLSSTPTQMVNIPSPVRFKANRDAERKVTRQSNVEPRGNPKRITGQSVEKSCWPFPKPLASIQSHFFFVVIFELQIGTE